MRVSLHLPVNVSDLYKITLFETSMQFAGIIIKANREAQQRADSPMHSFELRTSSTLPRCSRVTSNPEVEPQKRDGQN
jgi:hypothetical protein